MRLLRAWDSFWGYVGFLHRNRRQRKAQTARRRNMRRRQRMDLLEQRVVLNADPVAFDDDVAVMPGETAMISTQFLMENDSDADGDALTPSAHSFQTAQGVNVNFDVNGNFQYQAPTGFAGVDSFHYWIEDGQGMSNAATVRIHVGNHAPTPGADDLGNVEQNQTVSGNLFGNDSDNEGDALRTNYFSGSVTGGTLTVQTNGDYSFTADGWSNGAGNYSYTVRDAAGNAVAATLAWNVVTPTPVDPPVTNSNPTAGDDSYTIEVPYGSGYQSLDFSGYGPNLSNDADSDGPAPTLVSSNNPGTVWVNPGQTVSYTYTVQDNQGAQATGTVTINIVEAAYAPPPPANNAPTAGDDSYTIVVPFGSGYQQIDVSGYGPDLSNDTDSDGPPPTLVSSGNPGSVWAAPGQTVSYGYTIQDNQGVPATGTVTISIVEAAYVPPPAPNSAPTAGDDSHTIVVAYGSGYQQLDVSGCGPNLGNDSDSDGPAPTLVSSNNPGTVWVSPGQTVSYTYTIQDDQGVQATGTVNINIVEEQYTPPPAPNSAPTAGDDSYTIEVPYGSGFQSIDVSGYGPDLSNDTDSDGPAPTLLSSGNPGTVWVYPGQTVSYSYTIQDDQGVPATGTVSINIVEAQYTPPPPPANNAPTAGDDSYTIEVPYGSGYQSLDVSGYGPNLSNDSDSDGPAPTLVSSGNPGTVWVSPGQTVSYGYTIQDDQGVQATGTVNINIVEAAYVPPVDPPAGNSAPTVANASYRLDVTVAEPRPFTRQEFFTWVGATDVDGDTLTVAFTSTAVFPSGVLSDNGDGTFAYVTDNTDDDPYAFTISDGQGGQVSGTLTFHVAEEEQPPEEESGNVAPVAVSDSYSPDEDVQLDVDAANGVLANDSDPDLGPQTLSAVLVEGPQHAAFFNLEADGSFSYQATPDYFGSDSFTYKAFDGELYSAIRTVALTVGDTYDAPPEEPPVDEGDDNYDDGSSIDDGEGDGNGDGGGGLGDESQNHAPVFDSPSYDAVVAWDADAGAVPVLSSDYTTPLRLSAHDDDAEDQLTFTIKNEDRAEFNKLFTLQLDGTIKLAADASTSNAKKTHTFTVVVSDGTDIAEALVTISIIPVVGVTGDTHGIESEESDSDEGKDKIKVRFYRYGTDEDMNSPTPLVVRYTMMSESLYGPALGFNGGNSLDRAQKEDFDQASQSFFNLVGTEVRDGYTYDIYEVSFGMNVSYVDFDLTPIADGDADRGMEGFNVSVVPDDDHKYVVAGSIDGNEWDITVKGTEPRSNVDVYVLDGVTAFVRGSDDGLPPGSANLGINRTDVLQYGRLDCWFMAALLAAANDEWALLQSHVQPLANGQYNVQLYNEQTNAWEGFTVDAKLSDNLMMAQVADFDTEVGSATYGKSEVWPLLFERAMDRLLDRQRLNNPETPTTNTGAWSGIGWVALTGGDAHNIRMEPEVVGGPTTEQQVRNAIAQLRNEGYTQVLLTSDKAIVDPQDPDNRLLVPGHEVVVDLNESNENGLATMNPFGEVYDRFVPYDLIVSKTVIGVTGVRTPFSP